jgi:hypothetical protein
MQSASERISAGFVVCGESRLKPLPRRLGLRLAVALLLACTSIANADDLYVICNPSVSISAADLRDVFLGEKQFAGTVKLAPAENRAAQALFLDKVLKMSADKYMTTWTKKAFRDGVNPPPVNGSDTEARAFVRRVSGSCSYVTTDPGPGVVVAARF